MKKTKLAFMQSVVALLLCLAMLIGSTFAWFTDSVTSGINHIVAGNLDVELEYRTQAGAWKPLTEGTNVFAENANWEPGYTEVVYLRVSNKGNLALKYQLGVNIVSETPSINVNGQPFRLSQFIHFGAVADRSDKFASRTEAVQAVTSSKLISEGYSKQNSLQPNGEQYVALVVYMPESVGNDANHATGQDVPTINLGISLVATQYTSESDSFNSTYDDQAQFPVLNLADSVSATAVKDAAHKVAQALTMASDDNSLSANIPVGVQMDADMDILRLTVREMTTSGANITLSENEILRSLDVHIAGVAANNTVPMQITIAQAMMPGLNIGNYKIYHMDKGVKVQMTSAATLAELDAHNEFYYDPATGDMTLSLASFSEVALVADTENAWNGTYAEAFASGDGTKEAPYLIANADQLAYFGDLISNDNETYGAKYYKLIADINFGGEDNANNGILFYPIGYHAVGGEIAALGVDDAPEFLYFDEDPDYARNSVNAAADGDPVKWYTYGGSFKGTFDGNGHKISNIYQNTWQLKGNYSGNYWNAAMGLFGYVNGGTVKNLTVEEFSSDGEFTPTGVIAAYAANATFENIAIVNCNPRVYNTGNGGIVGIGGNSSDPDSYKLTFTNITIDNTNKISALWGSWDVACGGLVGMFRGAGHVYMTNCHVGAQIDVFNDVCGNYQYYWYRYSGMMIGTNKNMITDANGYTVPETSKFHAENCTVHFGEWNDYYYCELVVNSLASYTHDHQFSRLDKVDAVDTVNKTYTVDGKTSAIPTSGRYNYVVVNGDASTENATCYHFVNGTVWNHADAGTETVNGVAGVLKEDKQHVYLPFNQLFTGYGWGVKHIPVYNGEDYAFDGITILDREVADSVEKFTGKVNHLVNGTEIKLGNIFSFVDNGVKLVPGALTVTVTYLDENNPVSAEFTRDDKNWENGILTLTGTGRVQITIQDYYFCTPTTIEVDVVARQPEIKFETKFTGDFLYRVGNASDTPVALDTMFKEIGAFAVVDSSADVSFETIAGNATGKFTTNTTDWTKGTIQFSGTGIVKVTITDNDYCTPTELILEVVDAKNATAATDATANNVVLLNNIGSGFTVSGRYTVYGNGFTLNYTGNGQYLNNGLRQGVVTVSGNGTLDNLRIEATIYPNAYMYYGTTSLGDYVQGGPSSVEGTKTRYHYQLSAVAASDHATIQNCYISGGRNNIFINTGDVTVKDTVLECGVVANAQIQSNSSHTVTFENVTTIQYQKKATIGDTSKVMLGAGILVGPETTENPTIVLKGALKQYNWVTSDDANAVSSSAANMIIKGALDATAYNHTINGKTASNLGIIFMNEAAAEVKDNTGLPYKLGTVSMTVSGITVDGQVYSLQGASAEQIYSDYANADRSTENGLYQPQFKYDSTLGGQYVAKTDDGDEFCYREGDTIKVMFPSGDTKELDLAALVNITKYAGQNLNLIISCKDSEGNTVAVTDNKVDLSAAKDYTVTYTVTDELFFDKDGKQITDTKTYSWDVAVSVSLKDKSVPNAYFEFDATKQKMGYYKPTLGDVKQYLPFLAGLRIYDYNGQTSYLRFDGDADFNKVASVTITGYTSNEAYIEIVLTDGGVINTKFLARADSGGGSTYTGKIKTSSNTIYFVADSGTSNKEATTTAAYWYVDYYKFTGNNGVAIQSAQQTFNSTGSSASTPSGSFGTTIKHTVTYDANGGNCGQATGYATSVSATVTLPTPTRSGYIFAGWYTAESGGTRVGGAGEGYTPSGDVTLYAQWGKPCTVTYNANGGTCGTASEKYTGTALTLPTPTRDGYWFIGWYDAAEGGNKIGDAGATFNPGSEITLYAHWQEPIKYTVTYDANGGSCGTESATYEGTALTLPTPTRTGYTFNGWYTAASGGTKIEGTTYTPAADITLYAQWTIKNYTITVTTSNATVKVNGTAVGNNGTTSIPYGTQVTVEVTYSKNSSKTTTITGTDGTTYTSPFNMPAQNITINASSKDSCVTADTLVTLADGTQKRIDEVTFADQFLVWDFDKGMYAVAGTTIIENHGYSMNDIIKLTFDDGTVVKVVNVHGFFDADLNKWVDINAANAQNYVGHSFTQVNGNSYETVKLVAAEVTTEYVEAWSILTADHYNCMLEGMFSITPPATEQLAFFEIGAEMKYDADAKQADIEKYGLFTYEEFDHLLTYEQFDALNLPEIKVAIGKGLITYEEILGLIAAYMH